MNKLSSLIIASSIGLAALSSHAFASPNLDKQPTMQSIQVTSVKSPQQVSTKKVHQIVQSKAYNRLPLGAKIESRDLKNRPIIQGVSPLMKELKTKK